MVFVSAVSRDILASFAQSHVLDAVHQKNANLMELVLNVFPNSMETDVTRIVLNIACHVRIVHCVHLVPMVTLDLLVVIGVVTVSSTLPVTKKQDIVNSVTTVSMGLFVT
jgi:hypothetical protein